MLAKRLVAITLAACMAFLGITSAAHSEGWLSGNLTNHLLFDVVFQEASSASSTIEGFHAFSPLYSNGHWVRSYYAFGPAYVQLLMTSPGPQGRVVAVNIISDGEETPMFRELCTYAIAGLMLEIPGNITDLMNSADSLDELAAKMGIESAGYTFSIKEDGLVMYASLETVHPYDVERRLDIPTDHNVTYPLPPDTIDVKTFVETFEQVLADHYGMPASMEYIDTIDTGKGDWLHIYIVMDMPMSMTTEEPTESANIKNVNILDVQIDPTLLVGLAAAAFGTLADFDVEQYAAMGLLSGAHRSFDDFLTFLPTIAYNDMMLLFGMSQEFGAAYIMGVPDSVN